MLSERARESVKSSHLRVFLFLFFFYAKKRKKYARTTRVLMFARATRAGCDEYSCDDDDDEEEDESSFSSSSSSDESDEEEDGDAEQTWTTKMRFEELEAMAFSLGEDKEKKREGRKRKEGAEDEEAVKTTTTTTIMREALQVLRRATARSKKAKRRLKKYARAVESRNEAMKALGKESEEEEEEEEEDERVRIMCCERAIERGKKHARRARAIKEKVESKVNELQREVRVKTKAFEDAEKARLEALIPVKLSLEEEISQIRDEFEAAMRRIQDLRGELKKETMNAEDCEAETNETESVELPECKKVCAESMQAPAHARKKLDETTEVLREERARLETLDNAELKQFVSAVRDLKDAELIQTRKLNAIESEYEATSSRLSDAKHRFDLESSRKEEEKKNLRLATQRNDGEVQLLFEEAKDTEKSVLRARQREDGSKLKVLRKLKQTYRETDALAETIRDVLITKIRTVEDEKKENDEALKKLNKEREEQRSKTCEAKEQSKSWTAKSEESEAADVHKREEIRELEEEIVESSRTVEQLRKIELKMTKNTSCAKREVEKVRDSLQFIESEVKVKNATVSELAAAQSKALVRLCAMEKFVSALHRTREKMRLKIIVAQKEVIKGKTLSVDTETRENESMKMLSAVERKCEEEKARMRQREKPRLDEKLREVNASLRELETAAQRMSFAKTALQRDLNTLERSKHLAISELKEKDRIALLKETAANELIDVEDELENALNLSVLTENKSIEIDALIRDREIETQRLSNKVADVKRTKRATRATKSERVPRLKRTLVELRRALRSEKRNFRRASRLLEDPNREKRVKKLSPNIFSAFLTSLHETREDDLYYLDEDERVSKTRNAKKKNPIQNEDKDDSNASSRLVPSLVAEVNEAVAKTAETETRLARIERRRKLLFEILQVLDAEIQSFQKADADTLFARTKLARAMHATNRSIREMTRKTIATTAELGFSNACRVANEREIETLQEELRETKERNNDEKVQTENMTITPRIPRKQHRDQETHGYRGDNRRINAYVPENDPSGIGLPIPFAPFHAVAPSKILRSNG